MYRRSALRFAASLGASTLLGSALLGACAGHALATTFVTASPRPMPDAFACAQQQTKAVGFTIESHDDQELRLTARKYDEKTRRPDVQFRRLVDRLAIDVDPGHGDTVTTISVVAHTFTELMTHRGPTEQEESPSENAKLAAQAILNRCAAKP
jgi:hypothetical protein